jgi:uncharacterized protein involved in exopolysaccharide biosynthesis
MVWWALAASILAAGITLLLPKTYRAQVKILPTSGLGNPLGGSDLLNAGGISGLLGLQVGGSDNPVLTYPEIIMSRSVLERTLEARYPPGVNDSTKTVLSALRVRAANPRERVYKGWRRLRDIVNVAANVKSGLIEISVVSRDSVLSAYIANTLVSELDRFNMGTRSSRGRAAREFVHGRLIETESALRAAEGSLRRFQEANLRIGNSPPLLLEQSRLQREIDIQADLFRLLSRQYELARVEEHRDTPTFTILEPARPPFRKHRPLVMLSTLSAGIAASLLAYLFTIAERWREERRLAARSENAARHSERRAIA